MLDYIFIILISALVCYTNIITIQFFVFFFITKRTMKEYLFKHKWRLLQIILLFANGIIFWSSIEFAVHTVIKSGDWWYWVMVLIGVNIPPQVMEDQDIN